MILKVVGMDAELNSLSKGGYIFKGIIGQKQGCDLIYWVRVKGIIIPFSPSPSRFLTYILLSFANS
jgi:hypothetical protein